MRRLTAILGLVCFAGCFKGKTDSGEGRVELREVGTSEVELVPSVADLGYCLVFSIAAGGDLRQLTANLEDTSFTCEPGKPIGGRSFSVPRQDGRTRFLVLFSDQALNATTVAEQLNDLGGKPTISALDLSLPGRVLLETLEFTPARAE